GAAIEGLDDDHAAAAARAWEQGRWRLVGTRVSVAGLVLRRLDAEQVADAGEVLGAPAIGEQAVVADAVEAAGQDVDEEATDELVAGQRHDLHALASLGAVVLPPEDDTVVVAGDEAAVGDGDAMGVAAEIGEHRLRPGEGSLGIDDPLDLAQRRQIGREGAARG